MYKVLASICACWPHSKYKVGCLCKDCLTYSLHWVSSVQYSDLDFCHLNSGWFFFSLVFVNCDGLWLGVRDVTLCLSAVKKHAPIYSSSCLLIYFDSSKSVKYLFLLLNSRLKPCWRICDIFLLYIMTFFWNNRPWWHKFGVLICLQLLKLSFPDTQQQPPQQKLFVDHEK